MGWLKRLLLGNVVKNVVDNIVTEENYGSLADDILDVFERWAAKTDNTLDDFLVAKVRSILKIPDGDD